VVVVVVIVRVALFLTSSTVDMGEGCSTGASMGHGWRLQGPKGQDYHSVIVYIFTVGMLSLCSISRSHSLAQPLRLDPGARGFLCVEAALRPQPLMYYRAWQQRQQYHPWILYLLWP